MDSKLETQGNLTGDLLKTETKKTAEPEHHILNCENKKKLHNIPNGKNRQVMNQTTEKTMKTATMRI